MNVDLAQLSESEKEFDFTFAPDLGEETVKLPKPLKVAGKLKKGIAQIDVGGEITGEAEIECSRCLSPVVYEIKIPFSVVYVSQEHYTQDKESEIRGDDLEVAIYEDEQIDLSELSREQILLNIPTQIFCQADCKGLCPKCKANKNLQNCRCEEKEIDPRWAKLKDLKRD